MKVLLLDTSCPVGVVAIAKNKEILCARYLSETKQHSELLSGRVADVLKETNFSFGDLDGVVVGKGPGSFIGVRIAMAYAKGLCLARGIPLIGVGTLYAFACDPLVPDGAGLAVLDARRGEYYVQEFSKNMGIVTAGIPYLHKADELGNLASQFRILVGTPLLEAKAQELSLELRSGPTAEGLLLAFLTSRGDKSVLEDESLTLVPEYVRDPDAKPMPT